MYYKKTQHTYSDNVLISAGELATLLGVSAPAITKAKKNGRIDSYENSRGLEKFHKLYAAIQFREKKDRRHVTTATKGQMAAGFNNFAAQAVAHRPQFDIPSGDADLMQLPDDEKGFDLGALTQEIQELEVSKAQKEFHLSRLAKLKADMLEKKLVDKQKCFDAAYALGSEIQDKVVSMYTTLTPKIVGFIFESLKNSGVEMKLVEDATIVLNHEIGELIRKECIDSLRTLADRTKENILKVADEVESDN